MMDTREAVMAYLDEKAWPYIEKDSVFKVDVEGDDCVWQSFINVDREVESVVYYGVFPNRIAEDKMDMLESIVAALNLGFKFGNFELNRSGGELRYKTYQMFPEGDYDKTEFLDNLILSNIYAMDQTVGVLQKCIFSNMTIEDILRELSETK